MAIEKRWAITPGKRARLVEIVFDNLELVSDNPAAVTRMVPLVLSMEAQNQRDDHQAAGLPSQDLNVNLKGDIDLDAVMAEITQQPKLMEQLYGDKPERFNHANGSTGTNGQSGHTSNGHEPR